MEKGNYDKMYSKIIKVGDSQGITISKNMMVGMGLKIGDNLEVYIKKKFD